MPRPRLSTDRRATLRRRAVTWVAHLVLAAVAYIPLLRTAPGVVGADTKQYLYIDPASFMAQVASMWDPDVAMGTVTHQYIGYLLPMGPYYALMHVARRADVGGTAAVDRQPALPRRRRRAVPAAHPVARPRAPTRRRVARHGHGWAGLGAMVAALAYMLSPYVVQNEARESVLLLPWVGLPWMLGLIVRALRTGGWRHAGLLRPGGGARGQHQRRRV